MALLPSYIVSCKMQINVSYAAEVIFAMRVCAMNKLVLNNVYYEVILTIFRNFVYYCKI